MLATRIRRQVMLVALASLTITACGAGATFTPTATPRVTPAATTPTAAVVNTPTGNPAAQETTPAVPSSPTTATLADSVFRIVAEQSEARYRAREQLLGRSLPNDAVGRTQAIEGQIALTADGKIDPQRSRFTVDLTTLQSDETRRDNYIKQNTLEVAKYPTAEFQPTEVQGLPWPLPTNGQASFQLVGNLTVHGVTKPVTWNVQASFDGTRITGTATTQVTFQDFQMTPPRVPIVLSLEDTITLELDFTLEPAP
ncbi:Protein YceI [bacterium HR28]|nr:Protein YceI [bacterium HR28]